jgi:competence protein ComEC
MLGGDNIDILSPTQRFVKECSDAGRWNDLSIALRLRYGERSLLLPGDIEAEGWKEMLRIHGKGLKSTFLKASQHGRDSAYDPGALKLIDPRITFVSVGRKPDTDASSKYRQQCPRVASTRHHGNIELQLSGDHTFKWFVDRNADK